MNGYLVILNKKAHNYSLYYHKLTQGIVMKPNFLIPLVLAGFIMPSFCTADTAPTAGASQTQAATTQGDQANMGFDTVRKVKIIDKFEVKAADLIIGLKGKAEPKVIQYAKTLRKDHSANLKEISKMSLPKESDATELKDLQTKLDEKYKSLKELDKKPKELVPAYLDAMIEGHQELSEMLNTAISSASNEKVKKFLEDTLTHVDMHLKQAKELKEGTPGQTPAPAPATTPAPAS
ncbi:MAG: DUF4142 domain-containing protein [Legionella sp.]|nr:DUF4142 domain-containing protein [Legionella sp.]